MFPAAAKCMSSNGGPLWDLSPSTPDTNALQLFLTLPFSALTTPRLAPSDTFKAEGPHCCPLALLSWTRAVTKATILFFPSTAEERRYSRVAGHVSARLGLHHSSRCALSLSVFLFSFCLLCCILGKEVKIAFALQVLYVGVYKRHYKQILLY